MNSVRFETLEALATAARPDHEAPPAPKPVIITAADKAAGRGLALYEQAQREGRPLVVEAPASPSPADVEAARAAAIAAGRAAVGGFKT